ncbi:VanZ family protein [Thalassotalea sediminis]|uniref:VanZ family protein n=1 Tax=Thalassotalea sediminis TaxID=1759089 RepID=UPI0025733000|nr:VanZ family protein [Thalassotalea sediminis]
MKSQQHLLFLLIFLLIIISASFFTAELDAIIVRGTKIDSIGHIIGFFILTWILNGVFRLPLTRLVAALFCYAALTELGQWYLQFRNAEFSDFFADIVGITAYVALKWIKVMYFQKSYV